MQMSESEKIIRTLYEITNEHDKGFEFKVTRLLQLACERFNLDIGILSKIENNNYEIIFSVTPEGVVLPNGTQFDLERTFCSLAIAANGPVAYENVKESEINQHPAYLDQQLEAYIGTPIYVDGKIYGTFNFSSSDPLARKFKSVDIDALQLMGSWLGTEISRNNNEQLLIEANEKLKKMSITDPLTQLYNRRHFEAGFTQLAHEAKSQNQSISLILLDIDNFKSINDNYGHAAGDDVLSTIAQLLIEQTRNKDLVARYGGEEFAIVLPHTEKKQSEHLTETIRKSIENHSWENQVVTSSFGIETIGQNYAATLTIEDIIQYAIISADKALYFAKNNGRNQFAHYQNLP